jgi:hypothetical protein
MHLPQVGNEREADKKDGKPDRGKKEKGFDGRSYFGPDREQTKKKSGKESRHEGGKEDFREEMRKKVLARRNSRNEIENPTITEQHPGKRYEKYGKQNKKENRRE